MNEGVATAPPQARSAEWLWEWVATVDHKRIGTLYLLSSVGFFLLAGILALLMRAQLTLPEAQVLPPQVYNQFFTTHGLTMILWAIMPMGIGFANYFLPLMIGARDMAFPRLNALGYWLYLFGGLLLYYGFFAGGAPAATWFAYPPLTVRPYTPDPSMDFWVMSILVSGIGTIIGAINIVVTAAVLRAPGMTLYRVPIFVWTIVVTALIILWAFPTLTAAAIMTFLDRNLGAYFFQPQGGGEPLLYQHLFWWLGHPEVYVMILPAFGILSEVVPVFARKPLFGYRFVAWSTVAIGFYSFTVWAHHMFTVGMPTWANGFFSAASLVIAVPTGVKIFSWLGTLWGGAIRFNTAMLFCLAFIVTFTMGGLTGVTVAVVPFDWQVHDTYYVVAHFHYVLIGGSQYAFFAGAYYWFPKITGRLLSESLGKWHFWLSLIGFNLTFLPMHNMGMLGMVRQIYTYPAVAGLTELNVLSSIGVAILTVSTAIFLVNLRWSLTHGRPAGSNPWQAWTLEWSTSSPPPPENFERTPTVRSLYPLWEETGMPERRSRPGEAGP